MTQQFGRKVTLTVAAGEKGRDLSAMRFSFMVKQFENLTPNTAIIRVYNLSEDTTNALLGMGPYAGLATAEYNRVILQAGYGEAASPSGVVSSQYGVIFDGTIKQFRRGRERNVDNYLDIFAADGDLGYNHGALNKTLEARAKPTDIVTAVVEGMGFQLDPAILQSGLVGGTKLARGKVLWGLGRALMRDLEATHQGHFFIDNGVMKFVPLTSYLGGDPVVLNSKTGMIGTPEATDDGVEVTCLLNPNIRIGTRVQINNRDINTTFIEHQGFPQLDALEFPASVTSDGIYRVIVAEHEGDTRERHFYSRLTCLAIDKTARPINSVKAFG
jgi:hypothetical protein